MYISFFLSLIWIGKIVQSRLFYCYLIDLRMWETNERFYKSGYSSFKKIIAKI